MQVHEHRCESAEKQILLEILLVLKYVSLFQPATVVSKCHQTAWQFDDIFETTD